MIAAADGCKDGWMVAVADAWPPSKPPILHLCPDFKSVISVTNQCRATVVDIPIGLLSEPGPRQCDRLAMQQLRSAASSVFNPPPRQVLPAENPHQFQQLHGEFFCKPANPFSYGILKKIREVDKEMNPTLQERIMEFHPEVAWKNLAGRVLPSKHGASGILSRMDLIGQHFPDLTELKKVSACAKAAIDDLLDALVGLCVAHCIAEGPDYNRRLPPNEPPRDARGLRMEIWF